MLIYVSFYMRINNAGQHINLILRVQINMQRYNFKYQKYFKKNRKFDSFYFFQLLICYED